MQDTRWGSLTPLQKCRPWILVSADWVTHTLNWVQIPDETVLSSWADRFSFNLGMATSFRKGNIWIQTCLIRLKKNWPYVTSCLWKFVKELVILFSPNISSPSGSRGVHYKKSSIWRFFLFFPLQLLLATGPYCSSPRRQTYLVPSSLSGSQERRTHLLR